MSFTVQPTPPEPPPQAEAPADYAQVGKLVASGVQKTGFWGSLFTTLAALVKCFFTLLVVGIIDVADRIFTVLGKFSTKAQGEQSPEFVRLAATMVGDLLGIEPDLDKFSSIQSTKGRVAGMEALGDFLLEQLTTELAPGGSLSEEQGRAAVRSYLGFVMSFGVRESNVGLLLQLLPFDILQQFREMGVHVADNLGLGRLTRLALKPVVDTLIGKPVNWDLNVRYRPEVLPENLAVRAFLRGDMTRERLVRDLARKGLTDADIETIILESSRLPSEGEIGRAVRFKAIDKEAALMALQNLGMTLAIANGIFDDFDRQAAESAVSKYLSTLEDLRDKNFLDSQQFRQELDALPLSPLQRQFVLNRVGVLHEHPTKRLTFAEVQKAFVDGLVDVDYVDGWLIAEGYSEEDRRILTETILLAEASDAAKSAAADLRQKQAEERAALAAAKKAGKQVPPLDRRTGSPRRAPGRPIRVPPPGRKPRTGRGRRRTDQI